MIKIIPIAQLQIGMYICEKPDKTGTLQHFAEKGFVTRKETIEKILKSDVTELCIDTSKGKDSPFGYPVKGTSKKPSKTLEDERPKAEKTYRAAIKTLNQSIASLRKGSSLNIDAAQGVANEICNSVFKNQNALLVLAQIREKDQYLLQHSINVAILMAIWTHYFDYPPEERTQIVTGALFHDVGKIRVPDSVLNKPGKLTAEEWEEMKRHVEYGYDALSASKGVTDIMLDICKSHHERLDGSGYPNGIDKEALTCLGRMIAIADTYDAMAAERVYKPANSPCLVMKQLVELSDSALDKHLVYEFIRCFSIYPTGTLVELNNQRLGIVIIPNLESPDKPLIRTIFNLKINAYEQPRDIDLSSRKHELRIVGTRNPKDFKIKIAEFI